MAAIFGSILITFLILLNKIDCQNKVYYIATSAGYSVSDSQKIVLEKSALSNRLSLNLLLKGLIYKINILSGKVGSCQDLWNYFGQDRGWIYPTGQSATYCCPVNK